MRASLPALLALAAGCGNDVSTSDPRRPLVIEAAAGRGGAAGESSTDNPAAGAGGSEGGASGAPSDSLLADALGRACDDDHACPSGLSCLTDNSNALAGGSPPGGVCTLDCKEASLECDALGGRCLAFANRSFCMQRCSFGSDPKCHGRDDFACEPTYRQVEVACDVDGDCGASAVCRSGACYLVYPLCLPRCNGSADCPAPAVCDPVSGECVAEAPSGKALGAMCDPTSSEDECRGVCLPGSGTSGERCHEFCTLGASDACGAGADCVLTLDSAPGSASGDVGACAKRCSCDAACDFGLECVSLEGSGAGYCAVSSTERPVLECPISGFGGAPGGS
ncbi:MAG TPA: hypothetical protein VI197_34080 [Polyangiaceae bacterium]